MPKCPFCGHDNPSGVDICKSCAGRIPVPDATPAPPEASGTGPEPDSLESRVLAELQAGTKISAIKRYRAQTGVGLKEAKEAVEGLAEKHGIVFPIRTGCAGVLLAVMAAGAALAAAL